MIERVVRSPSSNTVKAIDEICNRCLGDNLKVNHNNVLYCEDCYNYQTVTSNHYLKRKPRSRIKRKHKLNLKFNLSKLQVLGENFIYNCYNLKESGFLHAVCGAGKTEMCLKTIYQALCNNESICFIIPRVEIIKQVYKRFIEYFPKTSICCLYQNQEFVESADIFLSTPHQLIKFYEEFDLMIIDEVDAYPFVNNKFLSRLINKSSKNLSTKIFISATLGESEEKLINTKKVKYFLIPSRYHNYDLVIPKFVKYSNVFSIKIITHIISYQKYKKRLMVFVPSISLLKKFHKYLNDNNINSRIISSKTKYKKLILKAYENDDFNILLTTTLLERGITFKKLNVFVIESDNRIFSKEVLVQISGRVGRDRNYPKGELIFFSRFKTKAMIEAKKVLKRMNKEKFDAM
ncbi:MAG: DEAD/DEAH box helicase [Candidatus Izimaplasma sp.]|nr:DEAD/DEAH box helicase [Candidatus Izimaplasma bacterium]